MHTLSFATTNKRKLHNGRAVASEYNVTISPINLDIDEIQSETPADIVRDKASRAFALHGKPVVVSDDSWSIPALNGFPGPYMKSINYWLSPDDMLRLMHGITDRRIVLTQQLAYIDGAQTRLFCGEVHGQIMAEPRGAKTADTISQLVALDGDDSKTIAEIYADPATASRRWGERMHAWHDLLEWYVSRQPAA